MVSPSGFAYSVSVRQFIKGTCEKHRKLNFINKRQAETAIQEMRERGVADGDLLRPFQCHDSSEFWHIGNKPSDRPVPPPLTYQVKDRVGELELPDTTKVEPSTDVEALLLAAEASGWAPAVSLAVQIRSVQTQIVGLKEQERELVSRLVDESQKSARQQELDAQIKAIQAQLAALLVERDSLIGAPEPDETAGTVQEELPITAGKTPIPAAVFVTGEPPKPTVPELEADRETLRRLMQDHPASNQKAIRAWCKANNVAVSPIGAISRAAREAYARAHPNG